MILKTDEKPLAGKICCNIRHLCQFLVVIAILWPLKSSAQTIEYMDAIMDKAFSVTDFLNRDELIEEYFVASQLYYGADKFPRESYDAIIAQMKVIFKRRFRDWFSNGRDLNAKAWRKTNLGKSFEIRTTTISRGRNLNEVEWSAYLDTMRKDWAMKISSAFDDTPSETKILEIADDYNKTVQNFEMSIQNLSKRKKGDERSLFYTTISSNPKYIAAASFLLLKQFDREEYKDALSSADADVILDTLLNLKINSKTKWPLEIPANTPILTLARKSIPNEDLLLDNKTIFLPITRQARKRVVEQGRSSSASYYFRAVRPFHGFFSGIPHRECVGGHCDSLGSLTPRRWAIGLLDGSQTNFLETDEKYNGNIKTTVLVRNDGVRVNSSDFMAPDLNKIVRDDDERVIPSTLFDMWLVKASKYLAPQVVGYVVGQSSAMANEGNHLTVRKSQAFKLGQSIGESNNFNYADPDAQKIINLKSDYVGRHFHSYLYTEAKTPGAGPITLLDPRNLTGPQLTSMFLEHVEKQQWLAATKIMYLIKGYKNNSAIVGALTAGAEMISEQDGDIIGVYLGWLRMRFDERARAEHYREDYKLSENEITLLYKLCDSENRELRRRAFAILSYGRIYNSRMENYLIRFVETKDVLDLNDEYHLYLSNFSSSLFVYLFWNRNERFNRSERLHKAVLRLVTDPNENIQKQASELLRSLPRVYQEILSALSAPNMNWKIFGTYKDYYKRDQAQLIHFSDSACALLFKAHD